MKTLSANGANIPAIGLGTWQLKGESCSHLVSTALQGDYTHVDTAIMYDNESDIGVGIKASGVDRDSIFLTTKVWHDNIVDGRFQNEVENSLRRLNVDYVDLLLIHWPPTDNRDFREWARLLKVAVEKGWARHIGVSNFTIPMIEAMTEFSDRSLACNQVENHPYLDQSHLRATCAKHDIALIAYCPLYRHGGLFDEVAVTNAAENHSKSPAQIVLRWHVQHSGAGAIPKTQTLSRLPENANIFDFELSKDEMSAISALGTHDKRICDFDFSPEWDAA